MPKVPVCGFKLERAARKFGFLRIAGCDEVGRGPMFGPVVAAAVILAPKCRIEGLNDSKKLSEKKRVELDVQIRENAVAWAISAVDVETIDRINIRKASLLAMRTAVSQLALSPDYLLIDGVDTIDWPCPQQAVIQGDGTSFSIAAASIPPGLSRQAAGGTGHAVSGLWAGEPQRLLLGGAPGGAGAVGAHAPAPQKLEPCGPDDARF